MDYLKYFQNNKYQKGINDCWTLVQDIFSDEKGVKLPDCPIMTAADGANGTTPDYALFESKLKSNFKYQVLDKPKEGCLIHFRSGKIEHIGYALNEKQYIHKTFSRVEVSNIPEKAKIYEVLY